MIPLKIYFYVQLPEDWKVYEADFEEFKEFVKCHNQFVGIVGCAYEDDICKLMDLLEVRAKLVGTDEAIAVNGILVITGQPF